MISASTPQFDDGSNIEVYFGGLEDNDEFSGGSVALFGLNETTVGFVFELANIGNFVIQPVSEDGGEFVTSAENQSLVIGRWEKTQVVHQASELKTLLVDGYEAWREFKEKSHKSVVICSPSCPRARRRSRVIAGS